MSGLFPAHAGVILTNAEINKLVKAIPRTRGGDPRRAALKMAQEAYSPHTRG